jgi:hypothetical protein
LIICRLKVEEWLKERRCKCWAAAAGTRQLKLFIEMPLDKLSRDLLALDRKQCRLVTGLLTGHFTLLWASGKAPMCRKCRQEEESWQDIHDLQLCMLRVDGHEKGPSQESYGFTIMVRALCRASTVSGGAQWA